MCSLYSITTNQEAIIRITRALIDRLGNLPPTLSVFPDYPAPIVRNSVDWRGLVSARWPTAVNVMFQATKKRVAEIDAKGKPVDFAALLRKEPDAGVTKIRNLGSKHRLRWTGEANRCWCPSPRSANMDESRIR